jgi:GTP pyrophosphokinase
VEQGFDDFTKAGFARLLKHFEDNTDDVVKLTRAFALANKAHRGHAAGSEPHVNHAIRVALILADELQMRDSDIVSAGLLHDALDGVQEQDVKDECGDRVAAIVKAAFEPKGGQDHEKALAEYFARLAKEPKEARCIEIADRLEKARSMKENAHREKAARFKDETQKHAVPLAQNTDERLALKLSVALYEIK